MSLLKKAMILISAVALVVCCAYFCGAKDGKTACATTTGNGVKYLKTIETDAEGWDWSGFTLVANEQASRTWETGTYEKGGVGTYRFKGDYLEIYGYKGPEGGDVEIKIDGFGMGDFSLKDQKDGYRKLIGSFDMKYGWHTLKITSLTEGKWHSIDYIKVDIGKEVYTANYNLALIGNILCSVPNPTGGGNRDLNVIRNEKAYEVGISGVGPLQYDSFNGSGRGYFYMGYTYSEQITFSRLVFQEGETWVDGGWFADGDVKVQVQTTNGWKDVELIAPVNYPVSDLRADFGPNCEIYTFDFKPIEGKAIRIIGMSGGTSNFVSVAQIEVYSNYDALTLHGGYDYRNAVIFEVAATEPDEPDQSSSAITSETAAASSTTSIKEPAEPAEQDGGCGASGAALVSAMVCAIFALVFVKKEKRP